MGWIAKSLDRRGIDPCPRFGDGAAKKADEKPMQEARVTKSSVTEIAKTRNARPEKTRNAVTETSNASNEPAKEKGKRGPSAKHASAAERQRAYRARKKGAAQS